MNILQEITLDLVQFGEFPRIQAAQGDTYSRQVAITLLADGEAWSIPEDAVPLIRYHAHDAEAAADISGAYDTLPDGTPAWSAVDNVLTIDLVPAMLSVHGLVRADVVFLQDEAVLATGSFEIYVNQSALSATSAQADSYYNVTTLQQLNETLDAQGTSRRILYYVSRAAIASAECAVSLSCNYSAMHITLDLIGYADCSDCPVEVLFVTTGDETTQKLACTVYNAAPGSAGEKRYVDIMVFSNGCTISGWSVEGEDGVEYHDQTIQRHSIDFSGNITMIIMRSKNLAVRFASGSSIQVYGIRA